jgi:ribosomal protein S18 acetylase RimI-like enzyme
MELTLRIATETDLPALFALDAECFPVGNIDLQPAPPGEIEAGVLDKSVFLAEKSGEVIGMLQIEKVSSNQWDLVALAITSAQRSQGVGQALMNRLFLEISQSPYLVAVSCITSPNNEAMQGLLESFGFVQVGFLPDHFGPGKHRLRFQLN